MSSAFISATVLITAICARISPVLSAKPGILIAYPAVVTRHCVILCKISKISTAWHTICMPLSIVPSTVGSEDMFMATPGTCITY